MRFFFDFEDGPRATRDREGLDCDSFEEARKEALRALPEVLLDDPLDADSREVTCSVRNDRGLILYRASITLKGQGSSDR